MSDLSNERHQYLAELVDSEGWRIFRDAINQEWGSDAILERLTLAIAKSKEGTSDSDEREVAKLVNARALVRQVLEWPQRELDKVRQAKGTGERPTIMRRA